MGIARPAWVTVGIAFGLVGVLVGCGEGPESAADAMPDHGTPSIEGTEVRSFETTSCSTAVVIELSRQIAEEVDCVMPGQLVPFEPQPRIELAGPVLPYMARSARADLYASASAGSGSAMRVTSGFRTVVQQYLLRRWYELGRCGIPAAAEPGRSNHESGRAVDLANYAAWTTAMANASWSRNVPGDPVHFEHLETQDIRGADVLAFQRLWNRNAPDDRIDEDGAYGPATEARIKRAPAEGFGIGAICSSAIARTSGVPRAPTTAQASEARAIECAD